MEIITPRPPGFAVALQDPPPLRFATPGPDNAFVLGFFDRGLLTQAANVAALDDRMGGRVNYSSARDEAATQLAEGVRVVTAVRVTGAAAVAASVRLNDSGAAHVATITAKSVGEWANGADGGLTVDVEDAGAGAVRIVVSEDGTPVATSPATDDEQVLVAWSDDQEIVTYAAVAARLPAVAADQPLAAGADDRANVRPSDWAAAAALLDRRYGPGVLLAPGVTDPEVIAVLTAHCLTHNRRPMFELANGTTKADVIRAAQTLRTDLPDTDPRLGGLFASHAYTRPIAGEPERLVSYAAVQTGIAARVYREHGIGTPPFGITAGSSRTALRLAHEWSDDDRHELYVAGVNVATDDGTAIATWGYRTLDLDDVHADLHHSFVRMVLKWRLEQVAARYVGPEITPGTQASFHGELETVCDEFVAARALHGFVVDTASVNDDATAAARERHALVHIRHTPTSDWVDVVVPILPIA